MAEPYDSATTLIDLSNVLQQQYFPDFVEQTVRQGDGLNRIFSFADDNVVGDGKTMQTEIAPGDTVRMNTDPLADVASPNSFQAGTIKVRWNQNDSTAHDFSRLSGSCQVDYYTIENGSSGAIVDVAARIYNQLSLEWPENLAMHRMMGRGARVALVNGTPKLNDHWEFANATSTATNSGGARLQVDSASISYFREGRILDFKAPSGGAYRAEKVEVTDVNYVDNSIGIKFNSSTLPARTSSGNLANIADNDEIYFSGEYNQGMYSVGAYMSDPDNDSAFIGGVTRTAAAYRYLIPHRLRDGASSVKVDKSHINTMARAMGYRRADQRGVVVICQVDLHDTLRDDYGEDAFVPMPTDDSSMARFANLGSIGLNYQHPVFGLVKIMADPLYTPGVVDVLTPNVWSTLAYGSTGKDLRFVPGDSGSPWYRMESSTPGNGRSLIYKADAICNLVDFCKRPKENARTSNLTA